MMGTEENQNLMAQLKASNEELSAILSIETSALGAENKEQLLENVFTSLMDLLKTDAVTILLREGHTLRVYASMGVEEGAVGNYVSQYGQGFEGKIVEMKQPLFIVDAQIDPLVTNPYIKGAGIHSILGAPMMVDNDVIGVIHADWIASHKYSDRELHILQAVAERCALMISNASLCERSDMIKGQMEMYLDIIEHDIQGLNKIMQNDLQTLLSSSSLKRDERQMVKGIMDTVRESETIVDNVRLLDRTMAEEIDIDTLDIDDILKESIEEALQEGAEVSVKYSPGQGRSINGADMVKDVFYSLISRAVKRSKAPKEVSITVDRVKIDDMPTFRVSIMDSGPGIPDDLKSDLFTFHMGMTEAHGKEMPLFIIPMLLDRIGGSIQVEDRVAGDFKKGSKFIVSLPAIEGEVNRIEEPKSLQGQK